MNDIKFIPSENFSDRKEEAIIDTIILHHTATEDFETALMLLTLKTFEVSSHYLIDYDGMIYQLVEDDKKAWHAGISSWRGREKINDYSIGIEIVNDGYSPFTDAQMNAASELCLKLKCKHPIDDLNVIAHSDVAPSRKQDPNIFFNWKELASKGIGIFSDKQLDRDIETIFSFGDSNNDICSLRKKMADFGYKIETQVPIFDQELEFVVTAFKRHHCPESYEIKGWDNLAELRLNDLLVSHYYE